MDHQRPKIKRQYSCQFCLKLIFSNKEQSALKSKLNTQLRQLQNELSQLKESVRDLKLENITSNTCLKKQRKIWKVPSMCFTRIEDDQCPLRCLSINSTVPLVRPTEIRNQPTINEPDSPTDRVDHDFYSLSSRDHDEYENYQVQPGCEVCKNLQEQIKKEIVEVRMLEKQLTEKKKDIFNYQQQVEEIEGKKQELPFNSQFSLVHDSALETSFTETNLLFSPQSPPSNSDYFTESSASGSSFNETSMEDNSKSNRLSALFDKYQSNNTNMKALQCKQDSIVEDMKVLQGKQDSIVKDMKALQG